MIRLKLKDVHNLENGLRIIVECNEYGVPIGKAAGIIAEERIANRNFKIWDLSQCSVALQASDVGSGAHPSPIGPSID
ncbi:hypothetical protein KY284_007228 [Solanum tuberosum]|nr:hypothetical protein KY284_007228 [Solanum tuberosum]